MKSRRILIFITGILIVLITVFLFIQKTPKEIIRKSFKYTSNKNLEKLKECYTDQNKDSDFRLFNIKNKQVNTINLITDNEKYDAYIISKNGLGNTISKDDVKIFNVEYFIEYIDEKLEPEDNGNTSRHYTLIKENRDWKIDSVGD